LDVHRDGRRACELAQSGERLHAYDAVDDETVVHLE
jgi:hypothetical protein